MNKRIVGVGDMIVSNHPDDVIVTYALGSCLGVAIYDPIVKTGGILHAMLPDSTIAKQADENFNPYKFVNTGIPLLFKEAYKLGADKKRLQVKIAGCSKILDDNNFFNIGKRNYAAARKLLWKNNVMLTGEFCDSSGSITLSLEILTGKLILKLANEERLF